MILDVFRCSQLFSDVFSWIVTFMDNHPLCAYCVELPPYSDIVFHDMMVSGLRMDFNNTKELDDPRYAMIPVIRWTLIIQKSKVIPPSLMVLFTQ